MEQNEKSLVILESLALILLLSNLFGLLLRGRMPFWDATHLPAIFHWVPTDTLVLRCDLLTFPVQGFQTVLSCGSFLLLLIFLSPLGFVVHWTWRDSDLAPLKSEDFSTH